MDRGERAEQLAAAVEGRQHWRLDGAVAVYEPPGAATHVRVVPMAEQPGRRPRPPLFSVIVMRGRAAQHNRPANTAAEAIRWAEGIQLD